jgi:8-oxo-dGTP pyrophosphatase MutT (NUDIX family)
VTTRYDDLRVEQAVSAGGVVYRRGDHGIEIVLCGRTEDRLWGLPKGTPEPGETIDATALREVREETGLGVAIVGDLGSIEYEFARPAQGVRFEKTVHHYLMVPDGSGSTEQHDGEYDRVEWFAAGEALRVMTYRNEAQVVRRALDRIDEMHAGDGAAAGGGR